MNNEIKDLQYYHKFFAEKISQINLLKRDLNNLENYQITNNRNISNLKNILVIEENVIELIQDKLNSLNKSNNNWNNN